jgi:uncharacterized protein (DUF1501 family)
MKNSALSLSRRDWLRLSALGVAGVSSSGWLERLAADAGTHPARKRACILLWMEGGPSQIDTFDPKPGRPTGGPLKAIATSVPGIRIAEHLPGVAGHMKHLALVRSMQTKEGDHGRAAYLLRTGNLPQEPLQYPTLGSLLSKELGDPSAALPNFVSIGSRRGLSDGGYGAGFLGPDYAPLLVGSTNNDPYTQVLSPKALAVPDLAPAAGVSPEQVRTRTALLQQMNADFGAGREGTAARSLRSAYDRAARLMAGGAASAFNLDAEPDRLRDHYGRNLFGQGCLLARRLVERGVAFVEVTLGRTANVFSGWDTHAHNFDDVKNLCRTLDPAWATLMQDLGERGLLDTTLVLWMGEFGRTPRINGNAGRDHYPNAWSVVLGGGGIKGGQVVGNTGKDGVAVEERPLSVPDLLATVCKALGIDHLKQNKSNIGRPIRIVNKSARPITEVLA